VIAGRFVVEREVAAGASGVVYRARDAHAGGEVALKLFHGASGEEPARLARLDAPGIARYVAHGVAAGRAWLATAWIDGPTLAGGLGGPEIARLARRLAGALAEAHRRGIVHGDVKPANVLLEDGEVARARLVDFGGSYAAASPRADVDALARLLRDAGEPSPDLGSLLGRMLRGELADAGEVVAALDVLAPRRFGAERRTVAPPAPKAGLLVGRDRELAAIDATIADSEPRAVLVVARAGMGKTALLDAVAAARADAVAAGRLLVVDDLHRARAERVAELGRRPVSLLAAARPEVRDRFPSLWPDRDVHELPLPPLPRRAALQLAPAHVVDRAGGNPLLLLTLPRGSGPLPDAARAVLESRLHEASAEARRVLRAASSVDPEPGPAALARLLDEPEAVVREALEELARRELLGDPLLREAARGTIE
jgi:tRNA A-37 threonylcarbamoyl transferase component Bud32